MTTSFVVESINISEEKGVVKKPVPEAMLRPGWGIERDAHAANWHRQVSFLSAEHIESFQGLDRRLLPGEFAENITTRNLDIRKIAVFDRIRIGEAELEVTQIGKECHSGCAIFQEVGACIMPKEGIFARVLKGGVIRPGMEGEYIPRELDIRVITLSDRAFRGEYDDRSGPEIERILEEFYKDARDHLRTRRVIISDDAENLESLLKEAVSEGADFVFTTGGTGVGPRDITPEVTAMFCDKQISGIMEYARVTFGGKKSAALLSRGIAGVKDTTVIFNLPGSVRAVREYMNLILPLTAHIRRMIHGIDQH